MMTKKCRSNRLSYLENIRSILQPRSEGFFAGIGMNADKVSALVRWVYRTFKIGLEGDCRDWDKIGTWANSLECSLS